MSSSIIAKTGTGRIELISGQQISAARELLGWTPLELAKRANIQLRTLNRAELLDEAITRIRARKIMRAFESAGVEFTNGDQPGVRLRKQG